jgi:predicted O-linked N-acetylglucosamine transferase (SPINDLY family)
MHSQKTTAPQQNTVIEPSSHTDIFQQALSLHQQGQSAQAELLYQAVLTQQPHHVDALHFLGVLAHQRGETQLAVDLIRQSLAINPHNAAAHLDIGCAFQDLQDFSQALASYNQALRINPNYAEAFYNRGNLLFDYQHFDKAVLSYDDSLKINPNNIDALHNRGIALKNLNRYDEAIASYAQALAINPDYPYLFGDWLFLTMTVCQWDNFEQHLNTLANGIKQHKILSIPFVAMAASSSASLQKKVAELYVAEKYPNNFLLPTLAKHTHSKIRIGYFSADFHHHATAYLMAELFERHDKSRFEIIAFSFRAVSDDMHLRLQSAFDQFIDVSQQSDEQVTRLARQLNIDIAVDLKGFTEKARTGLFAMRLAPIQVSYLGYPGTMGAEYMDYLIADSVLIPKDYQPYYTEFCVYLPNSYQVNDSTRIIADRQFTRAELGLPEQGFVFCCFNNNYKITPEVFACWMRLLARIDDSVLWLLEDNPSAANNLRLAVTASGTAPTRLIFAKRMPLAEHLARHRLADLFLDTLPCNAHTTCSDALWVGLPVLTCVGEGFASRVAASLLTALGLPELITTRLEEYEALAFKLATHPEQLAALKQNTLNNRLSYPLFNTALFTEHFESALQAMFDRYQAGLAPDHIYISAPADTAKLLPAEVPPVQNHIDLFQQAFSLHQQGQLAQAERLYEQLLTQQPQHIDGLHFFGVLCNQRGQSQRAVELINQSLAIAPNNAAAHSNLGLALQELKRFDEALASYDRALAIKPNNTEAHYKRGDILRDLKRLDEALASYDRALTIKPDYIEVLSNRGMVLRDLKRLDDALSNYQHILAIKPDAAEAEHGCGVILQDLKRYNEAIVHYGHALAIKPDLAFIFGTRLYLKRNVCDWQAIDNDLAQLIKKIDRGEQAAIPFSVLAMTACVAVQKKTAETYTETVHPNNFLLPPLTKHTHTKIKIAYFSSDFRHHPVAYLMAELFERHDKSRFEVIAFSLHVTNHKDDMRLRLEAAFDQFIDVSDQSDEQIVRLARELELDIAVDLTGCTDGGRTGIFAMRVAPIQVNYLGYSATMGADYMDYLLADRVLIPDEYQPYYTEKIAYLPNSYMASDSTRLISDRKFTRTELGLPAQGFVFCCFNNAYKITPSVFAIWMRLLHQIEGSVLWLSESNADATRNLQREATKLGISADRLIFAERLPLVSEHLARHRLADLFLDTLPYNAHTTSSDALWAGLPVLTCVDEAFASRVAASLLSAVGLPELITSNADDYEALAIQLATHPEQLAALKQKLATNRLTYPLFNTALFTQHFESALQAMFDRYQAGLAPDHIYVSAQDTKLIVPTLPRGNSSDNAPALHDAGISTAVPIELFQQAFGLHQQEQLAQAERLYEQLLTQQPQHVDALHFLGVLVHQRGQSQRAIDLISQSLEIAPDNAAAHSNLGLAFQELKRFEEALASYDRALALKPNHAETHFNRGNALRDLKRFEESLASYERALAIKPDYAQAFANRGNVLRELKRYDDALASYHRALVIKPDYAEAEHGCGVILQDLKRYNEAIIHYGRALAIKPDLKFILGTHLYLKRIICDWHEFDPYLATLIKHIERDEQVALPFSVLAMTSSLAVQKKAAEIYTNAVYPSNFLSPPLVKHAHSKIKIGYFSSDFRRHAAAYLTV